MAGTADDATIAAFMRQRGYSYVFATPVSYTHLDVYKRQTHGS